MSPRRIGVTEVALRDAHQSLMATHAWLWKTWLGYVKTWTKQVSGVLSAGVARRSMPVSFLNEDPWERLRTFRKLMPNAKLQMLLRGQEPPGIPPL